ncbi:diguanylate cyclase domain-containing protein [Halomonas salipaludis]|uniref:diguanylate cyclase n=1 Tax=Halomonas salipaludis TaxID=2032625 RepID=A0A2A2F1Z6_9GAMM|nr:diguanylate cyclase [Halomonas salipaludis]PAU78958.1 response regulator [Halomonas salipaludis]
MPLPLTSLRHRFLLALGGVLLMTMAGLWLIGRLLVLPALLEEEREVASRELDRLERSLTHNQQLLMAQVRDWAHWDDTYAFVQGQQPRYAQVNFSRSMFEDMDYQLMVFFDSDGNVYWVAGIDPASARYASCAEPRGDCAWAAAVITSLQQRLESVMEGGSDYLFVKPWPALVGISPVLRTDESGPPRGWLAKVRLLDEAWQAGVHERTGLPVSVEPALTAEPGDIHVLLHQDEASLMRVSRYLPASQPGLALNLTTQLPRDTIRTSLRTFRYALGSVVALMLLVIALVLLLLERMILRPLRDFTRFTHSLQDPAKTHSTPAALLARDDEIGTLAREFQGLLEEQRARTSSLLELARHDHLTGLANRRLFDARLDEALITAERNAGSVAVMMLDIDYFKPYNDHYGHQAGDACLVQVADCMRRLADRAEPGLRPLVARTGGEEFSLLLEDSDHDTAMGFAESLRAAIVALDIPHVASPVGSPLTVSIGVASATSPPFDPHALMREADRALYAAKAAGRNHVLDAAEEP